MAKDTKKPQSNSNQDINQFVFTKGMNTDYSPEVQPEGTYRAALNMVKESSEGDLQYLTSEYGNTFRMILPGKVIHANLIKELNKFVLFLDNNEIGLFTPNVNIGDPNFGTKSYKKLYKSPSLNFSEYVDSVTFTKTACQDIIIIFWDGKNSIKNLNVTYFSKLDDPFNSCNTEDIEFFKSIQNCIELNNVQVEDFSGYNIDTGMYRPFIQYEDNDGNTSNYYIINENIPVFEDNINSTKFEQIGGSPSIATTKSIVLNFTNVDIKYQFLNVGFIKTVQGVPTAFIFKKRQPTSPQVKIVYGGDTIFSTGIDINEILTNRAFYLSAKHGFMLDNRLVLGGVKGIPNINYQKYANQIKVSYFTSKISLKNTKGYKNPEHIIHHKTWMRDENYMLGIIWEYGGMYESPVFPLIGREYNPETDSGATNSDSELCCTINSTYWKEVNTAKRTHFNSFSSYLSSKDSCSNLILNNNDNIIRSSGELGFFESEERYPVIKDCDGEYMFPVEAINYKVVGKKIRLFKMPDSTIEPFHNNVIDTSSDEASNKPFVPLYDKLEIYPLGLKFENIHTPTLEESGGIPVTGYRIVYLRRDGHNKSIQDKGWFVSMFKNNFNGQDYIYPKHNLNSGTKWDYFSNLRNNSIEGSSPVQDFIEKCGYGTHYDKGVMFYGGNTMTNKSGLTINHIKIEQQYNSRGTYVDSIRGMNTNKDFSTTGDNVIDPSTFMDKDSRLRTTAIQIYNLYNYGYQQNTDGTINRDKGFKNKDSNFRFRNICTDNYSYVKDNVILNKLLSSEYSLVNYYRESGLYLDFKDSSNLSFHEHISGSFFNSDTSAKKCNTAQNGRIRIRTLNGQTVSNPSTSAPKEWFDWSGAIYFPAGTIVKIISGSCTTGQYSMNGRSFIIEGSKMKIIGGGGIVDFPSAFSCTSIELEVYSVDPNEWFYNFYTDINSGLDYDNPVSTYPIRETNRGYIFYGSIKRFDDRQYGSIGDMQFIDTGLRNCAGLDNLKGFYGDSFINTFSFVRTGVTGMLEDSFCQQTKETFFKRTDPVYTIEHIIARGKSDYLLALYLQQKPNVTLLNTVIESDYNLDLRFEGSNFDEVFYPKLANGKYKLYSSNALEMAEDCFLNNYFYGIVCKKKGDNCASALIEEVEYNDSFRNFHDNIIIHNKDYSELNGMRLNLKIAINQNYKTCDCDTLYNNRIIVSSPNNQSVSAINLNVFLINNQVTLPTKYGNLTNLFKENNVVYAHTTDGLWKLLAQENRIKSDQGNIYLGTNTLFSDTPLEMFMSNEGAMGLLNKRHSFQNSYGYYFADLKNQSLNLMSGGKIEPISDYGMRNFFKNQWNKYFNSYKETDKSDLNFGFDSRHKRLLLTDNNNDWTISYYPEDKAFYSFHSYIPEAYFQNRDTFFSQDKDYSIYLHEDAPGVRYRVFYGKFCPSIVDGVFNNSPLIYSTLNNVAFKIDAYKNTQSNQLLLTDKIPDKLMLWTNRQHSGEIILNNSISSNYMQDVVSGNITNVINGIIYYNDILNYVVDENLEFLDNNLFPNPTSNVSINKPWTTIDRMENNYFHYRLIIDNPQNEYIKYILKYSMFNFNSSIR